VDCRICFADFTEEEETLEFLFEIGNSESLSLSFFALNATNTSHYFSIKYHLRDTSLHMYVKLILEDARLEIQSKDHLFSFRYKGFKSGRISKCHTSRPACYLI
jgi:hypothetical protein